MKEILASFEIFDIFLWKLNPESEFKRKPQIKFSIFQGFREHSIKNNFWAQYKSLLENIITFSKAILCQIGVLSHLLNPDVTDICRNLQQLKIENNWKIQQLQLHMLPLSERLRVVIH